MRVLRFDRRLVGAGTVGAMAAAGFGGAQSADAAVIFQPVNQDVPPLYDVDLGADNDADTNEFDITTVDNIAKVASFSDGTGVVVDAGNETANLAVGTLIGPGSTFSDGAPSGGDTLNGLDGDGNPTGNFNGSSGFIGVQFQLGGNNHFGYVEYSGVADAPEGTVVSVAWEDAPDTGIEAGAVPEPTSLALLAAGAAGLGLYRLRRRSA